MRYFARRCRRRAAGTLDSQRICGGTQNIVYNEYIQDKEHVHMNGTQWSSLTQFVKYLGSEGIATVRRGMLRASVDVRLHMHFVCVACGGVRVRVVVGRGDGEGLVSSVD